MIPTEIALRNFMCYRADSAGGPLVLNLDGIHVVCLSGENGSGKSALLDAITWALWGEGRVADDELIAQGESEMQVALTFELGAQRYRVIRQRQRGGTGKRGGLAAGKSQLDLQIADGARWRPIGEGAVRETQAQINDLLRMSYNTFINASFLLQGRADEFTAKMPAERKQVLADILDLGEYDALERKARERARRYSDELTGLRGKIEQLAESAGKLDFWRVTVENAEQIVVGAAERVARAEDARNAAEERARLLEEQANRRKELLERIAGLRRQQVESDRRVAELRAAIAADQALLGRAAEIDAGVAALSAARAELERLDGLREQYFDLESRRKELQSELKHALAELKSELQTAQHQRDTLRERAARRTGLVAASERLEQQLAAARPLAQEREARAAERVALEQRIARLAELEQRRLALVAVVEKRQDSLVAAREEQQRLLRRLDEQLKQAPRWREELAKARLAARELADAEARLSAARERERADADQASDQRAACKRLKADADKLKADQARLDSGAGTCPICRSDLGGAGVERVHQHYGAELTELRANYALAKKTADQAEARLTEMRAAIGDLEAGLSELRRDAAALPTLEERLAEIERAETEREKVGAILGELLAQIEAGQFEPAAQAEIAALVDQLAAEGDPDTLRHQRGMLDERLGELERQLNESRRLEGSLDAQRRELAALDTDLILLPGAEEAAAALERRLNENDFASEIRQAGREVVAQIELLGYAPEAHAAARASVDSLRQWEQQQQRLAIAERDLANRRELLDRDEAIRERLAAELELLTREDARLELELRALPQAIADRKAAASQLHDYQAALRVAEKDRTEKRTYMRAAEEAAQELARQRGVEQQLGERQNLFAELGEALGKKGVQAMLIETAIPQIEEEANRLLGRMTDNQMHLSFEMQRDTKKGDTVETLDIKIADTLGTRAYDAFSGGEAMRANFAVRVALSRLLARRAGARLETLVVDEGFGSLDTLGRERMVEAITSVQADFRRIIVITHIDDLKDRFPAQIEITKQPLGSSWELR